MQDELSALVAETLESLAEGDLEAVASDLSYLEEAGGDAAVEFVEARLSLAECYTVGRIQIDTGLRMARNVLPSPALSGADRASLEELIKDLEEDLATAPPSYVPSA